METVKGTVWTIRSSSPSSVWVKDPAGGLKNGIIYLPNSLENPVLILSDGSTINGMDTGAVTVTKLGSGGSTQSAYHVVSSGDVGLWQIDADKEVPSGNSTYTQAEIDAMLSNKANTSDTYRKTDVDSKVGTKADKSSVYTKVEADAKFQPKAAG